MLLDWLRDQGLVDGCLLAADMQALHAEMCQALGWLPRAWNPIGRALAVRCTSGRKVYAHVGGRRMRVYPLPTSGQRRADVRVVSDSRRVAA
jgi:hypothetical protein